MESKSKDTELFTLLDWELVRPETLECSDCASSTSWVVGEIGLTWEEVWGPLLEVPAVWVARLGSEEDLAVGVEVGVACPRLD